MKLLKYFHRHTIYMGILGQSRLSRILLTHTLTNKAITMMENMLLYCHINFFLIISLFLLFIRIKSSIVHFPPTGVTALSFACQRWYKHTYEISRYFHLAHCSSACDSTSKDGHMHTCVKSRYFHFAVCNSVCHSPPKTQKTVICTLVK